MTATAKQMAEAVQDATPEFVARAINAPDTQRTSNAGIAESAPPIAPAKNGRCVGLGVFPCARMYCMNELSATVIIRHCFSPVSCSIEFEHLGSGKQGLVPVHIDKMLVRLRDRARVSIQVKEPDRKNVAQRFS